MNCCDRNCTFRSVLFVDENLKSYINFSDQDLCRLEEEFLSLQSITLDDIMKEAFKEAVIRHGDEEYAVVYRIDVLCYHLLLQNITSTSQSKFYHLFNLVRVVLCINPIHSTATLKKSQLFYMSRNI